MLPPTKLLVFEHSSHAYFYTTVFALVGGTFWKNLLQNLLPLFVFIVEHFCGLMKSVHKISVVCVLPLDFCR